MNQTPSFLRDIVAAAAAVLSFVLVAPQETFTQSLQVTEKVPQNAIFAEIGGKGLLYGVFYERSISENFGFGVGFSAWSFSWFGTDVSVAIIPVYASIYPVGTKHRIYIDLGADFAPGSSGESSAIGVAGFGYNYRGAGGGYFKVGPSLFFDSDGEIRPWANLSFGFAF
jgi:hypothetical protein